MKQSAHTVSNQFHYWKIIRGSFSRIFLPVTNYDTNTSISDRNFFYQFQPINIVSIIFKIKIKLFTTWKTDAFNNRTKKIYIILIELPLHPAQTFFPLKFAQCACKTFSLNRTHFPRTLFHIFAHNHIESHHTFAPICMHTRGTHCSNTPKCINM